MYKTACRCQNHPAGVPRTYGLVLFLTAGEVEIVQRRIIDAVKVNDILLAGGIFLLKFRKSTASTILKGKGAALQRNPPINGKLEWLTGKNGAIEVDMRLRDSSIGSPQSASPWRSS